MKTDWFILNEGYFATKEFFYLRFLKNIYHNIFLIFDKVGGDLYSADSNRDLAYRLFTANCKICEMIDKKFWRFFETEEAFY